MSAWQGGLKRSIDTAWRTSWRASSDASSIFSSDKREDDCDVDFVRVCCFPTWRRSGTFSMKIAFDAAKFVQRLPDRGGTFKLNCSCERCWTTGSRRWPRSTWTTDGTKYGCAPGARSAVIGRKSIWACCHVTSPGRDTRELERTFCLWQRPPYHSKHIESYRLP